MCLHLQHIIGFMRVLRVETGQSRAEASDRFALSCAEATAHQPSAALAGPFWLLSLALQGIPVC